MNIPDVNTVATPTVKSLVNSYLMLRVLAESLREQVDEVYLAVLTETPVYEDRTGEPILNSEHLYLCTDDAAVKRTWAETTKRLRAAGIHPADMDDEKCPALVAERDQIKIEWLLIDEAGKPFGISCERMNNLEQRAEFLRLITGLVMGLPDFVNPITKAKMT